MKEVPDCGTYEQFWHYIMTHYKKRYKESYKLEDKWISLALEVYKFGVFSGLGIDPSSRYICEIYRCSYKRMANFIRELGLWVERDWVMPYCLHVFQSETYFSKRMITITYELNVEIPHPFTISPKVDIYLVEEIMALEGFPLALVYEAPISRIDREPIDRYVLSNQVYDRDRHEVKINYEIVFSKGDRSYSYFGEYWISDRRAWMI